MIRKILRKALKGKSFYARKNCQRMQLRREALMIRMRGERHLLREEWVEDVEGKDKDLDGDLWKKRKTFTQERMV